MRLLLVCALVATASLAKDSLRWNNEPSPSVEKYDSFKPGFEYRFNLDAQIANGLPVPGSQQAISRTQTLVSLTFPEIQIAHLRVEKVRVGAAQKEITEPKNIQPFELFDEIELNEEQIRQIRLPVRFRYENGLISEIEFDREEQAWSTNMKRVILNMLQVNLSQENVHEARYQHESLDETPVFSAPERTLEGECDVVYTIVPTSEKKTEELRVTKSINFDKCSKRVGYQYNLNGQECPEMKEKTNIESSTVFNYRILGTPSRFLIKEVELRSLYSYVPLNQQDTFFTTMMTGNLRLIEVNEQEKTIPAPKSEKKSTMLYDLEWEKNEEKFMATGDESLLKESPFTQVKNKPEIVSRLIKSITLKSKDLEGVDLASTFEFARIVKVLRTTTKDELRRMHKDICETDAEEAEYIRRVFNDALAVAGTAVTVEHLVEKMKKGDISPVQNAVLLKQLSNVVIPSEKIVDSIISLCRHHKNQPLVHQTCLLTVGSLVNGLCGEHKERLTFKSEEKMCPRALKEKYVKIFDELYQESETRYEKVLAIKTLANSGMDLIVFPLEKIIRDEREDKTVRVQAIDALRKLSTAMPRKIQSILVPLYKNIREQPEIRVAAFHQVMQTLPERVVIDQITSQLEKEPSHQVYTFVYSALEQLSESEIPCEKRMAENIKTSLRLARVQPRKYLDSQYNHYTRFLEHVKIGSALNLGSLFSNNSALPKELMATLDTVFNGQWNKNFAQIGFSQNSIDEVLYKLFEKLEETGLEEVLIRGKRSSSTVRPAELLRGLFNKLSIKSRKHYNQDPHALVYIRFRDMDYAVLPFDKEVLSQMVKNVLKNGRIELGEIENVLAKGVRLPFYLSTFVYERTRVVITSMGAPLVFTSVMPTMVKMDTFVKAELTPKNGNSFDGLRLRVESEPSVASTHITKVELVSPVMNFGTRLLHSIQASVPVKMNVEFNWEKNFDIKTTFDLPKESQRLIQIQTRPVTFVRVWPKETRVYVEPKEKTIYIEQLETLVHKINQKAVFEKATGMKINVVGHVHGHIFEKGMEHLPSPLIIGENNIEVTYEKTEEAPEQYIVKIQLENFNEESRMERPTLENFFEKDNEEHFETEEFEEYPETEKERRGAFDKYVKGYKTNKGYSHRLFAKIHSVGARKERMAEVEIRSVCDEKMRHCKLVFKGERTPVTEEDRKNWKIESELEVLYPEMPESLEDLLTQKHRETVSTFEARWGSKEKDSLKIKVQGEQNKVQKKWIKRALEHRNRRSEERMTALEEHNLLVEASMLNQYKFFVDYKIECPKTLSLIDRFYSIVMARTPFFSTEIEYLTNEPRVIRAVLTVEPESRQYVNVTVESPRQKVVLRDLRLPFPLRLANIRRQPTTPIRSLSMVGSSLLEETKPMCTVESNKVNSFDNVIYRTPLTTCYSVLAKDCSSEQPEFVVLMKKIEKRAEEKKVQIIDNENVIELETKRDEIKVTVNGEEVYEEELLEKNRIYKNGEIVVVELEDINVHFDGYTAEIKMSEYYKNKQCGICGHFDGEKKNEFRRADNEETEDIEEFHRSYFVKNSECEVEEAKISEKKNYRIESEESSSEEESIFADKWEKKTKKVNKHPRYNEESMIVEPTEKTRVVEYSHQVCFSKDPVPECPRKTVQNEDETKEMKVKFACLPRSSPQAARLIREARNEIVVVDDLLESYSETIVVPRTCVVY